MGSSMKKISVMIGGSLLILGATTGVWYQANEELKQKEGLVKSFTTLNGIDISAKSYFGSSTDIRGQTRNVKRANHHRSNQRSSI